MSSLEKDLTDSMEIKNKARASDSYAQRLYAALCNTQWYPSNQDPTEKNINTMSWRYSGEMVARLRSDGGCYMDYYCSGIADKEWLGYKGYIEEGRVDPEIEEDMLKLGWRWRHWPKDKT